MVVVLNTAHHTVDLLAVIGVGMTGRLLCKRFTLRVFHSPAPHQVPDYKLTIQSAEQICMIDPVSHASKLLMTVKIPGLDLYFYLGQVSTNKLSPYTMYTKLKIISP